MFANVRFCLPKFLGIVGGMNKERDWQRLADFALSARGSRSQKAIDKLGGPSHTTLGKIERAEWRPTRAVDDTIQKLESVYRWAPGSVDAILSGGAPTRLSSAPEAVYQRLIGLQGAVEMLREEQRSSPENFSASRERELDGMIGRLAAARAEWADMEDRQHRVAEDARIGKLVELWLLAHRISNPESLDAARFTDAAVALARQVALFAESEVGGFSRMQELRQLGNSAEDCVVELVSPPAASHGDDLAAAAQADLLNGAQDEVDVFGAPGVGGNCGEGRTKSTEGAAG